MAGVTRRDPDARGYFGEFGGRFVPETLVEPVEELERAYFEARDDGAFQDRLARLLKHYVGRPTPVYEAERLTAEAGGARIFLKREDLTPVRSYKIRGAFNFMRKRLARGGPEARFTCASAGNHAQGFAFACRHFGVKGRVFMPVTTPQQKIDKTRTFGGDAIEIELVGDFFDDCYAAARAYAARSSGIFST